MKILALDFECFFDKDVSLKKLNIMEYVNHPKFKVMGVAMRMLEAEDLDTAKMLAFMGLLDTIDWYSEDEVEDALNAVDWTDTAVLCHHTDFDAYILSQVYGIKPAFHYDTMAMSRGRWPAQSASLDSLTQRLFPNNLTIRKGKELASAKGIDSYSPDLDEIIGNYAKNDVAIMIASFADMLPTYPPAELKVIDIVCRMFTQPKFVLDKSMTVKHRDDAKKNSQDKVALSGIPKEVLGSSDQFAAYLKDTLGITPPMKQGKKKLIPALGKNDISFQNLQKQYPQHKALWEARLATKSRIDETRAGRLLGGTNKDGTLSVPLRYYAAHCVPGDVEVLTQTGWQTLVDWNGANIAQWSPDNTIQFLPAKKYIGPIVENWVTSNAPYMPVSMTLGHKLPTYMHSSERFKEIQATDLLTKKTTHIPNAGQLTTEGQITPEQIRVLAMVQADGHWIANDNHGRCLTINIKKQRKINRARELFKAARILFTEHDFPSQNGLKRFRIKWADCPNWLTPERKFYGPWLLDTTIAARTALFEELEH